MTTRWIQWVVALLCGAVLVGVVYFPILRGRLRREAKMQQQSAEQARRDLTQPVTINPGEPRVKAKLYWASGNGDGTLADTTVELPLSSNPVLRAKQVLNTLLAGPVDVELRTLPPDGALLAFYLLPNGTAIADFSEALATAIPSGIQSEQLAVDSITKTLQANVPQVQRLKILIHGQEVETLAGHLDLTGTFQVSENAGAAPAGVSSGVAPATTVPATTAPATTVPAAAPSSTATTPAAASPTRSAGVSKPAAPATERPAAASATPTKPGAER